MPRCEREPGLEKLRRDGCPFAPRAGSLGRRKPGPEVVMAIPLLLGAPQGGVATLPPAVQAPLSRAPRAVAGTHSEDRSAGR